VHIQQRGAHATPGTYATPGQALGTSYHTGQALGTPYHTGQARVKSHRALESNLTGQANLRHTTPGRPV